MGSLSIWHWLIVLAVVLLLFGGSSKISTLMGDFAKGIKSFKKNMGEDESMEHGHPNSLNAPAPPAPQVVSQGQPAPAYQPHAAQVPYPAPAADQARRPG
jgi:sec-independent protein translocase protein TatA